MDKEHLGARIKEAQARSGKTVAVVAQEAGITPSSLHRVMAGQSDPSASTLAGIARSVGTTPDTLLGFSADAAAELDAPRLPIKLLNYAAMLGEIPPPTRRAVMQIVQALRDANMAPSEGKNSRRDTPDRSIPTRVAGKARASVKGRG
jgi:transcriptional regulator with XRE-family HTH domain